MIKGLEVDGFLGEVGIGIRIGTYGKRPSRYRFGPREAKARVDPERDGLLLRSVGPLLIGAWRDIHSSNPQKTLFEALCTFFSFAFSLSRCVQQELKHLAHKLFIRINFKGAIMTPCLQGSQKGFQESRLCTKMWGPTYRGIKLHG